MTDRPMTARPRSRRTGATVALIALGLLATALPAFGHASFPGYAGFDYKPNQSGGTGLEGSTPPYEANTRVTIWTRAGNEMSEPFNGHPDTVVDLTIVVPHGWTNPECGDAVKNRNDESTNFTNQPGDEVPDWDCEITEVGGHDAVHFSGPQIQSPGTVADSAQFWSFEITTPVPEVQTTYDGTGGTEGFIVDQEYASGVIDHWIPSAEYTGTPPAGSVTEVAGGLARTVAAWNPCGPPGTGAFPDVPADHLFCADIAWMVQRFITGGFTDGEFKPVLPVSRQAMAAFLYRYVGNPEVTLTEQFFADVPPSHQFYEPIQWLAQAQISYGIPPAQGSGKPSFGPTVPVSRQAMAAFLYRVAQEPAVTLTEPFFDDVHDDHPFYTPIQWMAEAEISIGADKSRHDTELPDYLPTQAVSRQSMSAFIHRFDVRPAPPAT